jgi:hypothetical protein
MSEASYECAASAIRLAMALCDFLLSVRERGDLRELAAALKEAPSDSIVRCLARHD